MVQVNPSLLEEQVSRYTHELVHPQGASFREATLRVGTNIERAYVFQAMQTTVGAYGAVHRELAKLNYSLDGAHRSQFANAFAAYVGAHLGRGIVAEKAAEAPGVELTLPPAEFERSEVSFMRLLCERHRAVLRSAQNGGHAIALSRGYYQGLIEETGRVLRDQRYTGLLAQVRELELKIVEPHTGKQFVFAGLDGREAGGDKSDSLDGALSLAEIGGNEEAKRVFSLLLERIRDPAWFKEMGIAHPGGVFLYGPPGTGKTAMVRAFAKESGLPYHCAKINEIFDPYHGQSERNLARFLHQSGVLFIDELDSLGKEKAYGEMRVNENLVNLLAVGLDEAAAREDVYVFAAGNYIWPIDGKLLRPPRFGTQVLVDYPETLEEHASISGILLSRRIARFGRPEWQEQAKAHLDYDQVARGLKDRSEALAGSPGAVRIAGAHIEEIVEQVFVDALLEGKERGDPAFPTTQNFLRCIGGYVPKAKDAAIPEGGARLKWR